MELSGRRVVVTGASRGIGEALARRFADAGADLALVARSAHALEKLAANLGGKAYPADLANRNERDGLIARIEADGPVDVLVNNAGVDHTGPFLSVGADQIDGLLDVNLHAPIQLSRQVLRGMVERGRGHIVNISSLAATMTGPGLVLYAASKAGLSHFTAGLREEYRGIAIGTTLVEVGMVPTDMAGNVRDYGPTARCVARYEKLGLLVDVDTDDLANAIVSAVRRDRRHVRRPRRALPYPLLVEAPRRLNEVLLTGVDHHTP